MARPLQLETFDLPSPAERGAVGAGEIEDLRLDAYGQGYAAGWDDAVAAQDAEIAHLRTDLGRNLQDMALNYRDARSHVLSAIEPLLQEMVAKVLPAIAHHALAPMIIEILRPAAEQMASVPITVLTATAHRETVERLLTAAGTDLPVTVRAEPSLSHGQAHLKIGSQETRIDLDGVVGAITRAVGTFFQIENGED